MSPKHSGIITIYNFNMSIRACFSSGFSHRYKRNWIAYSNSSAGQSLCTANVRFCRYSRTFLYRQSKQLIKTFSVTKPKKRFFRVDGGTFRLPKELFRKENDGLIQYRFQTRNVHYTFSNCCSARLPMQESYCTDKCTIAQK